MLQLLKVIGIAIAAIVLFISTPLAIMLWIAIRREEKKTGRDENHD